MNNLKHPQLFCVFVHLVIFLGCYGTDTSTIRAPKKCREIEEGDLCGEVVGTVNIARTIAEYLGFDDKLKEAKEALPVKF